MIFKSTLLDENTITRSLTRISYEIVEHTDIDNVVLVGIKTRGIPLAVEIAKNIKKNLNIDVPVKDLDISLYRDDLSEIHDFPIMNNNPNFEVKDKDIILVDDVISTGRTVRAAIEAIFSLGRPKTIKLAVLVDRGHRELPIRADFVGKNIPTSKKEEVCVKLLSIDGKNCVELYER